MNALQITLKDGEAVTLEFRQGTRYWKGYVDALLASGRLSAKEWAKANQMIDAVNAE